METNKVKFKDGILHSPRVKPGKPVLRRNVVVPSPLIVPSPSNDFANHKKMEVIRGIVVHQTDTESALRTSISPNKSFHFLIELDGTIYQTLSMEWQAHHVGLIHSRCILERSCPPTELDTGRLKDIYLSEKSHLSEANQRKIYAIEKKKKHPFRFPTNEDSIGIECVGKALGYVDNDENKEPLADQTNVPEKRKIYKPIPPKQMEALKWLVNELSRHFNVPMREVFRHPEISWKHRQEGRGWNDNKSGTEIYDSVQSKYRTEQKKEEAAAKKKAAEEAAKNAGAKQ